MRHYGINSIDSEEYDNIRECDFISGCAMLIKSDLIIEVGSLDKNFFMYYEDADLSIRAKKYGWTSMYTYKSRIWHKVSKSVGSKFDVPSPLLVYYTTRNRIIFSRKHNNTIAYLLFILYFCLYKHPRKIIDYIIYKKNVNLIKYFYLGIKDGIFPR